MTTIIMMFMLPIGIVTYFWDKRVYAQNLKMFTNYIDKIKAQNIENEEKMRKIDIMFYENGYEVLHESPSVLHVKKKYFNVGILFIIFGFLNYIGLVGYIIFYMYFLKPRVLEIDIDSNSLHISHL